MWDLGVFRCSAKKSTEKAEDDPVVARVDLSLM
jgi:hypothetical protein